MHRGSLSLKAPFLVEHLALPFLPPRKFLLIGQTMPHTSLPTGTGALKWNRFEKLAPVILSIVRNLPIIASRFFGSPVLLSAATLNALTTPGISTKGGNRPIIASVFSDDRFPLGYTSTYQ
jgi:hypothetical protein